MTSNRPLEGMTVVFTGQFETFSGANARSIVEKLGGTAEGKVHPFTDLVVVGVDAGIKAKQAISMNIRTMNEPEFVAFIGGPAVLAKLR